MRQHIREVGPITVVTILILTDNASFEVWAHFVQGDGERHFGVSWTVLILFRLEGGMTCSHFYVVTCLPICIASPIKNLCRSYFDLASAWRSDLSVFTH